MRALRAAGGKAYRRIRALPAQAAERGLPSKWLGYRWVGQDAVADYVSRTGEGTIETVHPPATACNPLPRNVASREELPADRGWWGYSFRDVPNRASGETFIATVPDCRIVSFVEPGKNNFYPCIVNRDGRALTLREIAFRPGHGEALRSRADPVRLPKATWILERVYHNHSHWLSAHLPKLRLLRDRGELEDLILPQRRNAVIDDSLRLLGLDPEAFASYDPDRPLDVGELTIVGTDRFRPELLRPVRDALTLPGTGPAERRIFISRSNSRGRSLVDEAEIWPLLEAAGFERTFMEDLSLEQQIRLMRETAVLFAPHGAGLTNMMFCPPGTHVVEIADLSFPNPNFYALASAMGHHYWVVAGEGLGDVHPLDKDLRVGTEVIAEVLRQLDHWTA
ncbi:MAG: glycosyltransferase family 61 protein [Acetobacterales bacterium]